MSKNACLVAILTAAIGVLGFDGTLEAQPSDSQRLRGLGGRVFLVSVTLNGQPFSPNNCYFFETGGNWYETGFPTAGTWTQHSVGASTTYSVDALAAGGLLQLLQDGQVTPARGSGVLQLIATSTLPAIPGLEFVSVGYEIDLAAVPVVCAMQ